MRQCKKEWSNPFLVPAYSIKKLGNLCWRDSSGIQWTKSFMMIFCGANGVCQSLPCHERRALRMSSYPSITREICSSGADVEESLLVVRNKHFWKRKQLRIVKTVFPACKCVKLTATSTFFSVRSFRFELMPFDKK